MTSLSNIQNGPSCTSQAADVLDHRAVRHTVGRIDAVFRTCVGALVITLYLAKVAIKGTVCILTVGQLYRIKSLNKIWDFHGLASDLEILGILGYKTLIATRDIIVAPNRGYSSAATVLVTGFKNLFNNKKLGKEGCYGHFHGELLNAYLLRDPFLSITDALAKEDKETFQEKIKAIYSRTEFPEPVDNLEEFETDYI